MESESLWVESKNTGCFHGESALVKVVIDKGEACLTIGLTKVNNTHLIAHKKLIPIGEARRLISHFLGLAQTPQKFGGDWSTTVYEGCVEWVFGKSEMKWQVKSSESPLAEVNELLQSKHPIPNETRQKIEQSRIGYFNLAHELHTAVMKITKEYSQ